MTTTYDRNFFFNCVRANPFSGSLSQSQVDGMNYILDAWESAQPSDDDRHLAYCLATTHWETSQTMQPIEEYGKGAGYSYGVPDPETGETYYGRGFVQLTWKDNYLRAANELGLVDKNDLVWHPDRALDPTIAANIMFRGMEEGWFRSPNTLGKYFNDTTDDPYNAREIINGDKAKIPSWSRGVNIGNLIAESHHTFLSALKPEVSVAGAKVDEPNYHVEVSAEVNVDVDLEKGDK